MVYDCFMMNGEYDMLEIRFNILNEFVDKFVICESEQTFSGNWKPLFWTERGDRFDEWADKVMYCVVGAKYFPNAFDRAAYQKDRIRTALGDCKPEDIIYYGDIDEIWKPQTKEGKLRQLNYSYYLNNRSSEVWEGTNVFRYKSIRNLNVMRADHSVVLEDGGWHFTNMFNFEGLINKIESYDHQEVNIPWVKDGLQARMEANVDYLGRTHDWQGKPFTLWEDSSELPNYILDNKKYFEEKNLWR